MNKKQIIKKLEDLYNKHIEQSKKLMAQDKLYSSWEELGKAEGLTIAIILLEREDLSKW